MTELTVAEQYYQKGEYGQAIQIYQELLHKNPNDATAYQGLGRCYLHTSRLDDAYTASMKALELDQQLRAPLVILGGIYLIRNELEQAEIMLQRAIEIDPNQADAYIILGQIKLKRDQIEESMSALQKALLLNPNSWQAHFNLGFVYNRQKSYRDALKELWIAFQISPDKRRTGYAVLLTSILVYATPYAIVAAGLSTFALIVHSAYAWPLILISSGYIFLLGHLLIKSKKYGQAATSILFGIALIVFYAYYVYALPSFFR